MDRLGDEITQRDARIAELNGWCAPQAPVAPELAQGRPSTSLGPWMILRVASHVAAEPGHVWRVLIDWAGQSRWIPFTTVDIISDHDKGIGVRAVALSGFRLGGIPVGLLDNFVVTGWTPRLGANEVGASSAPSGPLFHRGGRLSAGAARWGHPGDRDRGLFPAGRETGGGDRPAGLPLIGQASVAAFEALRPSPRAAHDGCGTWSRRPARCPWSLSAPEYLDYHDESGASP